MVLLPLGLLALERHSLFVFPAVFQKYPHSLSCIVGFTVRELFQDDVNDFLDEFLRLFCNRDLSVQLVLACQPNKRLKKTQ